MTVFNFERPSRQSAKGIIVNLGISTYKIIRGTIIIIAAFFIKYIQSDDWSINFSSPKIILPIIGFILFILTIAILKYRNFLFHVTKDHFVLSQGIINKEEISVSKSKIQNVLIKQNLLQQIINVVALSIETAGDDKTEIEIVALSKERASALKQALLSNVKVDDIELKTETDILFKASIKHLLLEGITENHFRSFLLVFAFIIGTYRDVKDIIDQLNISTTLKDTFNLDDESLMALLLFNISLVLILLIVAFFFSVIKTLVQNFDLKIIKKTEGLEISKGLFNKINIGLIASRLQTTTIKTNRFKRILGLYQLNFTQAMMSKKQRLNFKAIGLSKSLVNDLLTKFYPKALPISKSYKPNKYLIYRISIISIIPLILLNGFLYFAPTYLYWINVPLVTLLIYNVYFIYKKVYYSIDDTYIIVGGGALINTTTSFLEISKVQSVTLKQTIFQRRRHLATLNLHSASKDLDIPHIDMNTALKIKNYLLYKIEVEDKEWM